MNTKVKNTSRRLFSNIIANLSDYNIIIGSVVLSAIVFYLVRFLEDNVYKIYISEHYLVFHTISEYASILMYIASFLVVYYVGERNNRTRMKIIVSVLLFVGVIDYWHTFSYKGMPGLLVDSTVQSATAFWIIGRLSFAGGILVSSFIPEKLELRSIKKWILAGVPLLLAGVFLIYISHYPQAFPVLFIENVGITDIKKQLEYIIIFLLIIACINYIIEYTRTRNRTLALFISAIIISIFSEFAFVSYVNVYDTYNLLGHIYKVIASYLIFKVIFIYNINYPYSKLDKAEKEISIYATNLEQLVDERTAEVNHANMQLIRDLEYAKSIQKAIMPVRHGIYDNVEVYCEYIPYEKVGGDYYGFDDLNEDYLAFYIGDVAGHGVPAAMMTIFIKQTIETQKLYQSGVKETYSPNEALNNLYIEYNSTDFPLDMYAVMIYGLFNKKNNKIIFSSAGLNTYPLVYEGTGDIKVIEHNGFPICKINKDYKPVFNNYEISIDKGNKILFYTDGIIDVRNRYGETFGEDRLISIFGDKGHLSPEKISEEINCEIEEFIQGTILNDDIHYIIMAIS